jgi:MoaA/NifB/PqqE/SkfB family radical SAM enzyme
MRTLGSTLRFRITRGCTQACAHCPDSSRYVAASRHMDLSAVEQALGEAFGRAPPTDRSAAGRWLPSSTHIIVTGGEPTDHPRLPAILAMIRSFGRSTISLATNGVRLVADPALLSAVLEARVDQLLLSGDVGSTALLRSADHAAAARHLLHALRLRRARPRLTLNVMVFDRPLPAIARQLERVAALQPDAIRVLRFDEADLPSDATRGLPRPSDETWAGVLQLVARWNAQRRPQIAAVDRNENIARASPHVLELGV